HHAHPRAQRRQVHAALRDRVAQHDDVAGLNALEPVDAPDEGGLARARRPAHDHYVAGGDGEVDVAQHVQLAEPFVGVPEDDRRLAGRHPFPAGGLARRSRSSSMLSAARSCSAAARRSTELSTAFANASAPPKRSSVSGGMNLDRKSTRLNSSHVSISYAVFCLKKKKEKQNHLK